jgi:Holliday junction DNA helicase RuvA
MIGQLTGRLVYKADGQVMIDVSGVGYIVHVSERTMMGLPAAGAPVRLFTELLVREDLMQLFGFPTLLEKEWHRLLIGVQGIGAKGALAILSVLGPEGVSRAIALGDWGAVKAAPGVGPKIAQRVVNELKDKAPAVMALGARFDAVAPLAEGDVPEVEALSETTVAPPVPAQGRASAQADALSALENLGYSRGEAAAAVATAAAEAPEGDTTALIRAALRLLAPKG